MSYPIRAALGVAFACAFVPAHAASTYQATFNLNAMPVLRTGIPGYDGPGMLDGQWAAEKHYEAEVHTREQVGTTVDPDTGAVSPVWGNGLTSGNKNRASLGPHAFGSAYGNVTGPDAYTQTTGSAIVDARLLATSGEIRDVPAEVRGWAAWNRDFYLEAGTTITFAGVATLAIAGDVAPLDATASFLGGNGESFASLAYRDVLGRAGVLIDATLSNLADGVTGVFDYAVGPGGLLSLTISNTSGSRLYGNLSARAFIDSAGTTVAAPVPEPATWLMLLGGAALVGGVARRRQVRADVAIA